MNKNDSVLEESVFCQKLADLLQMPTFNDITFNCKDGGVNGNRLILSIYSNFLANIFSNNPLITSHPIHDSPDSGINLPELHVKDVQNLLKVINAPEAVEVKLEYLKGLQNVAKVLQVALIIGQKHKTYVRVQAIPKCAENDANGEADTNDMSTNSEQSSSENDDRVSSKIGKQNAIKSGTKSENNDNERENESDNELIDEESELDLDSPNLLNKVVCPICNITCKTPTGLRVHIGLSHRDSDDFSPQEEKGKRVCKCGKMFAINSRKLFKEHKQKCAAYRKEAFICEICKSPFDEMPSLTIHLTSIHGINKEPNSCICGQTFKTKHRVRKHSITCKIYRDAAVFCEVCNLPFLTNNHLQQHYRTSSHKTVVNKLNKRK